MNAADAARLQAAGIPDQIIMPDIHVGAGGGVEQAEGVFNNLPSFKQSAINCETNAGTHDMRRALNEAADLIDFFTAPYNVTARIYARTASFCTETSAQFDNFDQGLSFFLPNMTWLQPPGYVHVMINATWAETTLASTITAGPGLPFAAQRSADGSTLVLRAVNSNDQPSTLQISFQGVTAAGPAYTLWTLSGPIGGDNTPSAPDAIVPVQSSIPIAAGASVVTATLAPYTFAVMSIPL